MYNDIRLSQSMLDEADQDTSLEVCIATDYILNQWLLMCPVLKFGCYGYEETPTKQNSTLQTPLRVIINMLQVKIKFLLKIFNLV